MPMPNASHNTHNEQANLQPSTCTLQPELSRRAFLRTTSAVAGSLALGSWASAAAGDATAPTLTAAELPKGAAPLPVPLPHFPDRLHAFVWRNWPLVPVPRMAKVVGAKPAEIERLGRAMGLGAPPPIGRDQQARSYISVIKRNWHLLPYEQLLILLEWTADKLAYTLREDDFLFVKLGNLKPQCAPLRYQPPDRAAVQRQKEIARLVRAEFPQGVCAASDPLFGFVAQLSRRPASDKPSGATLPPGGSGAADNLKFCYSYFALYGDPLLDTAAEPYPDGFLARLADAGVNGVWLQAVLYKLAPFPWEPARSARFEARLNNLRELVDRAAARGVKVFLYLNEPRAMPLRFFESHAELKGVTEGDHAALCTSTPEVQRFMTDSVASICRAVPGLGGFFSISASENLTNCWSHGGGGKCPRCSRRTAAEVIAEVNRLFYDGIRQTDSRAQLIAWDWGWDDGWAGDAIQHLPEGVALMSVSEWRLPINRGGVQTEVGEYSISAIGPGPRATRHWELAGKRGLKSIAKIQAGNTWELSAVPHIPAVENVARHAENLHHAGIKDLMLGWTLGGYPSSNLEVVSETLACGSAEQGMSRVAERRFGPALAPAVINAWRSFSAAFSKFPYHGGLLYSGPQQVGPANLLWSKSTGYRASMVGFPYDDLEAWRAVYPPAVFIEQFDKMADGFSSALERLRGASGGSAVERRALAEECDVAEACALHFRSAANQARFILARAGVTAAKTREERAPHLAEVERLLNSEIKLARRLHQLQCADSRLGFEASNQYYYVPVDLAEKVLNCRDLLTRWLAELSERNG
jgi:hypothetical protein